MASTDALTYAAALKLTYVTAEWVLLEMGARGGQLTDVIKTEVTARNAALLTAVADAWEAGLASA